MPLRGMPLCPISPRSRKPLCANVACARCAARSLAHHLSETWVPRFRSANPGVELRQVPIFETVPRFFPCSICDRDVSCSPRDFMKEPTCDCCRKKRAICANQDCSVCLLKSFSSHPAAKNWDTEKNERSPWGVSRWSHESFIMRCLTPSCDRRHEYTLRPADITSPVATGCPFCANKQICQMADCAVCFNKSLASDPRCVELYDEENQISARQTFKNCCDERRWCCPKCPPHHCWVAVPNNVYCNERGCPYCANKRLCQAADCEVCFNKSLASDPRCVELYDEEMNTVSARQTFKNGHDDCHWRCPRCPRHHVWLAAPYNVCGNDRGCPYCANKKLCEIIDCELCFIKSLASDPRCVELYDKESNAASARQTFKYCCDYRQWSCPACLHKWVAIPSNVYGHGTGCSKCRLKTERKFGDWLTRHYPDVKFETQVTGYGPSLCKMDFLCRTLRLAIEVDGPQHFRQVSNWQGHDETRMRDVAKMADCLERGISVIRLLQEDIWSDQNDWETKVARAIEARMEIPEVIYIDTEPSVYRQHKCDLAIIFAARCP